MKNILRLRASSCANCGLAARRYFAGGGRVIRSKIASFLPR
jgi:hypothetical protein